ncbi:hypothetical protein D0T12_22415 [Actinomadura spongiicola]|uniref:Uncharacterized protein n=1 Tax=Actinomadura spongiicola TaxID=2303421 RepID=A0A372GC20_9ACTN|nr:hypothetical protein [Actinomadura spongiicola]RFS82958.1 hypothetical protein D0T12_22415 [Actinomadura spongiicola]
MTIHADGGAVALTDTDFPLRTSVTTTPSPMSVSSAKDQPAYGNVEVLVSTGAFIELRLYELSVTFTVTNSWDDDGPGVLTPDWGNVTRSATSPPAWDQIRSSQDGEFLFRPKKGQAGLNETVRIRLSNVPLSRRIGVTNVVISALETEKGSPVQKIYPIGKFPQEFQLADFRASSPIVQYGKGTDLLWTVRGDSHVTYELHVNGKNSGLKSEKIKPPLGTGDLHATTVYQLVAVYQNGQEHARHATATTVIVGSGDVDTKRLTAERATITHQATIAGLAPACAKPLVAEDGWLTTSRTIDEYDKNYLDVGPGLLVVTVQVRNCDAGSIAVTLYNGIRDHTVKADKDRSGDYMIVPTVGWAYFRITREYSFESGHDFSYTLQVSWLGFDGNHTPPILGEWSGT